VTLAEFKQPNWDVRFGHELPPPSLVAVTGIAPIAAAGAHGWDGAKGHVWTVPAVQKESDFSAKRSGAAMYTAYCRLEDYLFRDAATMAAGPDVIR
jgi:hypothetical protein